MKKWTLIALLVLAGAVSGFAEDKTGYLHAEADRLVAVGQFEKALKLYQEAALISADDDKAHAHIGTIYQIKGNFKKAKESFMTALDINPDNEMALQGLQQITHPDGQTQQELLSD